MIFGVSKENAADRMLFNEVADDLSALPVQTDDKVSCICHQQTVFWIINGAVDSGAGFVRSFINILLTIFN